MPVLLAAVKISGITVSFEFKFNGSHAIVSSLVVHYSVGIQANTVLFDFDFDCPWCLSSSLLMIHLLNLTPPDVFAEQQPAFFALA